MSEFFHVLGTGGSDDGWKLYLAGIIVLVILLIISSIIIAYFVYQTRQLKTSVANTSKKNKERDNSNDIYDDVRNFDENYVLVEDEQLLTYTALKKSGRDESDDHEYRHLNEVPHDYVNQKETVL